MSQARNINGYGYTVAGGRFAQQDHFHVSDRVYVPDGDAGTECALCFQDRTQAKAAKEPATVSLRFALIFLTVLAVICGFSIGGKLHARKEITLNISSMQSSMISTHRDNQGLLLDVQNARDSSRVCYIAVNKLGMVVPKGDDIKCIDVNGKEAKDTKAETNEANLSAAQELPLVSGQAQLTGSR